ncbi:phosphatidylinositol glycan anchor biosynthesis class W a [Cochliomyia hominivorax]
MNAHNILSNCIEEHCHNDEINYIDKNNIIGVQQTVNYCNAKPPDNQSLSLVAQLLACSTVDKYSQLEILPKCSGRGTLHAMTGTYDKHSLKSFYSIWHIQCTIIVTLIAIAVARAVICFRVDNSDEKLWLRYFLQFIVICLPVIVSVNVANSYVEFMVIFASLFLIFVMWRTKCWQLAAKREYEFGRRPSLFTLMRATINFLTALCILAIDFKSFPKNFRKSRRYGVGLMDVGIGLFVLSMGLVTSRPRKFADLRKHVFTVGCMLILGLARTIVIRAIDYQQDEHEYGVHLNAFFTLGLTKLFATTLGFLAKNNKHLLVMGSVILLLHEAILQCGIWKFVMDPDLERSNFLISNREGLCSLPGFIALYFLSQFLGQWLQAKDLLNFAEIQEKLKHLTLTTLILWFLVSLAIFVIGIARVTCNLGYVLWILAIAITMCALYLFVFDIILDTLRPVNNENAKVNLTEMGVRKSSLVSTNSKIPLVIEAVNYNGLTFFLLANILTGCTNIFLATDEKSNIQSVFILFIYMFITTTFIFILYRYKIRIA